MCFRDVIIAARRLRRAMREAAGTPIITVSVDYRDGGVILRGKLDENPPPSDIVVVMQSGHGEHEVAHASWNGTEVSGKVDPDGVIALIANDGIEWDDVVKELGHASGGGQMALPFPKGDDAHTTTDIPRDNVADRALVVPDTKGPDFERAMEAWLQGVGRAIGRLDALVGDLLRCEDCGKLIDEDEATSAWGEYYCEDHAPPFCYSCEEPIQEDYAHYDEHSGNTYCEGCMPSARRDFNLIWAEFYEDHPELRETDALQMAADEEEMEPEAYVTLFRDLPWRDSYGGSAWRHIAETWQDMVRALSAADAGKGDRAGLNALIDHAFDLVHNNGSLFTKAKEGVRRWLFQALETKYFLDPLDYRDKLSADVRKLLDLHIRYRGGVRVWKEGLEDKTKVMARFEDNLLQKQDMAMAKRLWDVHGMDANMFRGRESFLEVAFWSESRSTRAFDIARRLREFLRNPTRKALFDVMEDTTPDPFEAGTSHPAGEMLRREFVPRALKLLESDPPLRAEMAKRYNDVDSNVVGEFPAWSWSRWGEFFRGERRRRKDDAKDTAKDTAIAAALLSAFIRTALKPTDFYDFYALTLIDCGSLPDDEARMCAGLKRVMSVTVGGSLIEILKRAVIREARHVKDALGGVY